ncbi:GMP synthase subunit A [Candidatus Micrarchaeota archaeon]|nr:GMP synthase subunit A [Candidatus Micrarchaeota archaeon]
MKIIVIDNGSQWTHRIYRTLRDLDCDSIIMPNTSGLNEVRDADALVLSGGSMRVGKDSLEGGNNDLFLKEFTGPILGVCAGMQLIGKHYGSKVKPSIKPEFGKIDLLVDNFDDLFQGVPEKSIAWASHNDEVSELPKDFILLAHSKDVKIHAFKHSKKPVYGTLFHPEVQHTEFGEKIYANFIQTIKR